jgi:hypothetical protein
MISKDEKNPEINFIASVREDRIEEIETIARKLKELGCVIDNILSFSGVITGRTPSDISLKELKIDGIKNIEADREVKAISKITHGEK